MFRQASIGRIVRCECIAELKKAWRTPIFLVPTIITPVAFYAVYVLLGQSAAAKAYSLATFGVFATVGPPLLGFGTGVAMERENGVLEQKRVSALPPAIYLIAKLAASATVSAAALALVFLFSIGSGAHLAAIRLLILACVQILVVAPTAAIGFGLGMRLSAKGAGATSNLVYFFLSLLGGLWIPASFIPGNFLWLAWITPTFNVSQLALAVIGQPFIGNATLHVCVFGLISCASLAFALRGWSRPHM